ncbi:MAG: hypothetical protein ACR2QQ_08655 [Gammaproteobacteria bacterium]
MLDVQPKRKSVLLVLVLAIVTGALISGGCTQEQTVEPSGVLLEWLPPAEYDDGGNLPEDVVTEYRIYVDQEMVQQVAPDATEYFLELPAGEWEVTISAVADGIESRLSESLTVVVE